jgi:hypothetical protein
VLDVKLGADRAEVARAEHHTAVRHQTPRSRGYVRHGTIMLFAVLDVVNGQITRVCKRSIDSRSFWTSYVIDRQMPLELDLRRVDNYMTHKQGEA